MTPLYAELNRWLVLPHRWGETDCVMLCADWVRRWHGTDPALDLRMTYASMSECQRVTRFFTEPLACIGPRMDAAGLSRADAPRAGDVGLIVIPGESGQPLPHGALCLGATWAVKRQDGSVLSGPAQQRIAAWRVDYAHP